MAANGLLCMVMFKKRPRGLVRTSLVYNNMTRNEKRREIFNWWIFTLITDITYFESISLYAISCSIHSYFLCSFSGHHICYGNCSSKSSLFCWRRLLSNQCRPNALKFRKMPVLSKRVLMPVLLLKWSPTSLVHFPRNQQLQSSTVWFEEYGVWY